MAKKIKNIVFVCDYAYFEGGAANIAIQSVLAFSKYTDFNIYCFVGSGNQCAELKNSRANVIELGIKDLLGNKNRINAFVNGIYNKKVEKEFKKLLKTLNNEETIVHIHTWTKILSSAVFKVCDEMKFTTFLTIHEYFLACPNGAFFDYNKQKICEINPLSIKCLKCNCDARNYFHKLWRCWRQAKQNKIIRNFKELNYIFISEYQQKQLLKRIPYIQKKYLVKNIINASEVKRIEVEKNSDYIYIGRLSGEKGPQLFCEAITKAGVHGVVIGKGILEEKLKKMYPNIEFIGWQNKIQINERLKKTRVLIFPTLWYEGSPLTVPEVQAHGIPCIVTNCSSATDDIENGKNGEIIDAKVEGLVEAINKMKNDEYVKILSINTLKMFDPNRISEINYINNLLNVYEEEFYKCQ